VKPASPKPVFRASEIAVIALVGVMVFVGKSVLRLPIAHGGDAEEVVGLEAGTADQGTVNVSLGHQALDVIRLDTAAIEDAHGIGRRLTEQACQQAADEGVHLLRLGVAGGLSGTNRPDRLVGDDRLGQLVIGEAGQSTFQL